MKLSEAIRLGAMMRPQGRGNQSFMWWMNNGGTCALGAAAETMGIVSDDDEPRYNCMIKQWPFLNSNFAHPISGHQVDALEIIWKLNDIAGWTRERIADWVATIEPQDVQADAALPCARETKRMRA